MPASALASETPKRQVTAFAAFCGASFGATTPVVVQFQYLVYRASWADALAIVTCLLLGPLAVVAWWGNRRRRVLLTFVLASVGAAASFWGTYLVVPNKPVATYPPLVLAGTESSRYLGLVLATVACCSLAATAALRLLAGARPKASTGASAVAAGTVTSAVGAHLSANFGWTSAAPFCALLAASMALVAARWLPKPSATRDPERVREASAGAFPLTLGFVVLAWAAVYLNHAFQTRKQVTLAAATLATVAGVLASAFLAVAWAVEFSGGRGDPSLAGLGPPGGLRVRPLVVCVLGTPLVGLALLLVPDDRQVLAVGELWASKVPLGAALALFLFGAFGGMPALLRSSSKAGRSAGATLTLALPFALQQASSAAAGLDVTNWSEVAATTSLLLVAGAALVGLGALVASRSVWPVARGAAANVAVAAETKRERRHVGRSRGAPKAVNVSFLALLVASASSWAINALSGPCSWNAGTSTTQLPRSAAWEDDDVVRIVGNPFGVVHGSDGTGGIEEAFHVAWNRKDLPWSYVEPAPGSFVYNGRTVEDEWHPPPGPSLEVNLTMPVLGPDGATLADLDPGGDGYYGIYLETDPGHEGVNYFGAIVNNATSTVNLSATPPPGVGLLVTYNQTKPLPFGDLAGGYDAYVANLNASGVRFLPILDYGNPLYGDGYHVDEAALPYWARYVNRTVARYADVVDYWEVWNEPNNRYGVDAGTWRDFFNVLEVAADVVNELDPTAKLVVGGLGGTDEMAFLEQLLREVMVDDGYYEAFDGIAVHPYSTKNAEDLYDRVAAYRETLQRYGWTPARGKSLLVTEFGFPTNGSGHAGARDPFVEQAHQVVKGMAMGAAAGFELFVWYCESDAAFSPAWSLATKVDSEMYFGLFLGDGRTPKPAAHAFNLTAARLSDTELHLDGVRLGLAPGLSARDFYAFDFRDPSTGRRTLVAWTATRVEVSARLVVPGRLMGAPVVHDVLTGQPRPPSGGWWYDDATNRTFVEHVLGGAPEVLDYAPVSIDVDVALEVGLSPFAALQVHALPLLVAAVAAWGALERRTFSGSDPTGDS
ncbi:MAG: hypothetical protein Kow0069_25890 [Promethearchaeota archaeon]